MVPYRGGAPGDRSGTPSCCPTRCVRRMARVAGAGRSPALAPGFEHPGNPGPRLVEPPALRGRPMRRIVVTGGSGKAGRAVVSDLVAHDFDVVNVDVVPTVDQNAQSMRADLTDFGASVGRPPRSRCRHSSRGHSRSRNPDDRAHLRHQRPEHLQRVRRRGRLQGPAGRVGFQRDCPRPAVRRAPCPQPARSGCRPRTPSATRLPADRRGPSSAAAFVLLAVKGPWRGDGSAVRTVDRDPVHRASLLRDP